MYVCASALITYNHTHTHVSTHAGTDICMIMYASIHLYVTHKPSHVCHMCLYTYNKHTYSHKHMHTHLKSSSQCSTSSIRCEFI